MIDSISLDVALSLNLEWIVVGYTLTRLVRWKLSASIKLKAKIKWRSQDPDE